MALEALTRSLSLNQDVDTTAVGRAAFIPCLVWLKNSDFTALKARPKAIYEIDRETRYSSRVKIQCIKNYCPKSSKVPTQCHRRGPLERQDSALYYIV
jgi:hypothetical protein